MKKALLFILVLCLLSLISCGAPKDPAETKGTEKSTTAPKTEAEPEADTEGFIEVGGDWHVWGLYDFAELDGTDIVIDQVNGDDGRHIGYDIYADGESLGALLCSIRCHDGGFVPEDMDKSDGLVYDDRNGDGKTDIGAPLKSGEILWYAQTESEYGDIEFVFFDVQDTP